MNTGNTPRHIGKYELRELLGRGGMAQVWKAWDTQIERYVAIKILHAELQRDIAYAQRLFAREARAVASLRHPNIVQVHDFQMTTITGLQGEENTIAYMVMDYVEGETLADAIRNTSHLGKFPTVYEILYLFTAIGSAIDYAHRQGMIHRDIKPANILLDRRNTMRTPMGEPILTDFGIAKLLGSSTATLSGAWLGTPSYISPEQAQGHTGNERSDIYSLGVILYEICTGVRPFSGDSPIAILTQHIHSTPPAPALINPHISPALSEVILRSLAKEPLLRFYSAADLVEALAQAFNVPSFTSGSLPNVSTQHEPFLNSPSQQLHGSAPLASVDEYSPAMTPSHIQLPLTPDRGAIMPVLPPLSMPLPAQAQPRRNVWLWRLALPALLLVLLTGTILGKLYLFPQQQPTSSKAAPIVGHASFGSSAPVTDASNQGLDDLLQVTLKNIPQPASGKHYYAWLLSDENSSPPTYKLLGMPSIISGTLDLRYTGDPQHSDLLGTYSRFLITEESAPAGNPYSDKSTWRYYSEIPQKSDQNYLDYLRTWLVNALTTQDAAHTQSGMVTHIYTTTRTVLNLAQSAHNDWQSQNFSALHHDLVSIIDYLDGTDMQQCANAGYVCAQRFLPPGEPVLVKVAVPLFDDQASQSPASYLSRVHGEMKVAVNTPGITQASSRAIMQADYTLFDSVMAWLGQVHQAALQLIMDAQLLSPQSQTLLDKLVTNAIYAFNGGIDPATGKMQNGVQQAYDMIQGLASFDVTAISGRISQVEGSL